VDLIEHINLVHLHFLLTVFLLLSIAIVMSLLGISSFGPSIMGLALMTKRTNMVNVGHGVGIGIDTKRIK
jgi:hypothetical protein